MTYINGIKGFSFVSIGVGAVTPKVIMVAYGEIISGLQPIRFYPTIFCIWVSLMTDVVPVIMTVKAFFLFFGNFL